MCRLKSISFCDFPLESLLLFLYELHGNIDKFKNNIILKKIPQIGAFYTSLYGLVGKKMKTITS